MYSWKTWMFIKGEEAKRIASGGGHLGRRETSWDCGLL